MLASQTWRYRCNMILYFSQNNQKKTTGGDKKRRWCCDTHIKEGACVLQDQLAGVWFVLAVIHIYVELISLEKERRQLYVLLTLTATWDASSAQCDTWPQCRFDSHLQSFVFPPLSPLSCLSSLLNHPTAA